MAMILAACNFNNPVVVLSCVDWLFTADYGETTIDNTGTGEQQTGFRVYDGSRTLIYDMPDYSTETVGNNSGPFGVFETDPYDSAPEFNPLRFEVYSVAGGSLTKETVWFTAFGVCEGLPFVEPPAQDPQPAFVDGRINNFDSAAPVVIYAVPSNGGMSLHLYNPDGVLLLVIDAETIANAPSNPETNTLIAESNGITLYRITGESNGLWQINAPQYNGKTYVIIFNELFADGGYTSYEID